MTVYDINSWSKKASLSTSGFTVYSSIVSANKIFLGCGEKNLFVYDLLTFKGIANTVTQEDCLHFLEYDLYTVMCF